MKWEWSIIMMISVAKLDWKHKGVVHLIFNISSAVLAQSKMEWFLLTRLDLESYSELATRQQTGWEFILGATLLEPVNCFISVIFRQNCPGWSKTHKLSFMIRLACDCQSVWGLYRKQELNSILSQWTVNKSLHNFRGRDRLIAMSTT